MIEINGVPIEDLTVEKLTDVKFEIEREIDKKEEPLTDWIENERP
jgi:hypothetical protein